MQMLSTTHLRLLLFALFAFASSAAAAEDGYDLWLRYRLVEAPTRARYSERATAVVEDSHRPTLQVAANELRRGLGGLLGRESTNGLRDGAVVLGTPTSSRLIAGMRLSLEAAGNEGYCLKSTRIDGHPATVIAANNDVGVLYGVFAYLRLMQTRSLPPQLAIC